MKEQIRELILQQVQGKQTLTEKQSSSRLKGGDIFMAENSGETNSPKPQNPEVLKAPQFEGLKPQKPAEKIVPSAKKEEARRRAIKTYGDLKKLPFEERQTINAMIEAGVIPEAGAAERLNLTDYTDPILNNIVKVFRAEVDKVGEGKPLDPRFVNAQLERVRNLTDNKQVNVQEGGKLEAQLNEWMREALQQQGQNLKAQEEARDRELAIREYGAPYTEEEILNNKAIRDEVFNNLFAGVDSTPHEFFDRAFNPLTYGARYENFIGLIRNGSINQVRGIPIKEDLRQELEQDFQRYQTERRVRQSLHDMNAILYLPTVKADQLYDSMQQFSSDLADFALRSPGVRQMMDLYEANLRASIMNDDGYLKPEAVLGEVHSRTSPDGNRLITSVDRAKVEKITKEQFESRLKEGKIILRGENGSIMPLSKETHSWEIDRIFTISRGMMIVSERLLSLAAESRLPKDGQYTSLFLQDIIQSYSPYIHLLAKYGITESGLAAYLYKDKEASSFLGLLRTHTPNELKKTLEEFEKDPLKTFYESNELLYLMRGNPNRAGDIFTWLSWRIGDRPDAVTMSERFLKLGKDRMKDRIRKNNLPIPTGLSREEYENEYANWIGTGLRFEKLRSTAPPNMHHIPQELSELRDELRTAHRAGAISELRRISNLKEDKKTKKENEKIKEEKEYATEILREDGRRLLLKRMSTLQSHRLYSISPEVRARVNKSLGLPENNKDFTEEQKNLILETINSLSILESSVLENREKFLDEGKTFDAIDFIGPNLSQSENNLINEIKKGVNRANYSSAKEYRREVNKRLKMLKKFAIAVRNDFKKNEEAYMEEFSTNREYKHGFVLWSGDAPLDEFNASALGPTGGFARRARDNKAQAAAVGEEIKLLGSLKHIKSGEQLVKALEEIYAKIAEYDPTKAKQATAEKAEGIIKFFLADTRVNIPILGQIMEQTGHASLAQLVYGKMAPVWHSAEARFVLMELHHKQFITEEKFQELSAKLTAGKREQALDIGSTLTQFAALAILLYMLEKTVKG